MKPEDAAKDLLATCSVGLHTDTGLRGTAFFVAPGYAVTAAHVIGGTADVPVTLHEGTRSWRGQVADVRPPLASDTAKASPYPAPDVALIRLDDGPAHACALLGRRFPKTGAWVMARGYTDTFDPRTVTAETESFRLTGLLETTHPGCTLLKLGLGEVTRGMSGAPVLDLNTAAVIGMLRTSRQLGSNLGGWVVPADLLRRLWPDQVDLGNDDFHRSDSRWHEWARALLTDSSMGTAPAQGGTSIQGDMVNIFDGGTFGSVEINYRPGSGRRGGPGHADD